MVYSSVLWYIVLCYVLSLLEHSNYLTALYPAAVNIICDFYTRPYIYSSRSGA